MGTATLYTPFRSFRDDMDAIGLFLDSGGKDTYLWEEADPAKAANPAPPHAARDENRQWPDRRGANSWGFGADLEAWSAPGR
jgi:hypothetical protein